tara:strand:- start:3949 stop:4317 length:369 start_codon:yes stop_codon:yes gene_type:complete
LVSRWNFAFLYPFSNGRMETSMAEHEDEWIRQRAYALWEQEGRPSGRDAEHWEQARQEHGAAASKTATSPSEKSGKLAGKTKPSASADAAPASGAAAKKPSSKGSGEKKSAAKRTGKPTAGS